MTYPDPRELGFLPDRLERINANIQSKYLGTGKLPRRIADRARRQNCPFVEFGSRERCYFPDRVDDEGCNLNRAYAAG